MTDAEILELAGGHTPKPGTWGRPGHAGARYVRTPEGSQKYGLPIGARITRDAILRAKSRGRHYNVPEDNNAFGSQAPAVGRTARSASELVSAIRNAPAPRRVEPTGPKKIAVGNHGFSFPEGSRTYRPNDHQNFVIVRTPDYQLVVATDHGVAFDLDGELEKELNAELDDHASQHFTADEPNLPDPNAPDAGAPDPNAPQVGSPEAAPGPARVEDMPGFLSQPQIDDILSGMEQAGVDQHSRDMAELQLHRNNNRIRSEFETNAAGGGNGDNNPPATATGAPDANQPNQPNGPDANAPDQIPAQPQMERTPQPTPDRQPQPEKPAKAGRARKAESAAPAKQEPAPKSTPKATPAPKTSKTPDSGNNHDSQLSNLEELARNRPNGVSEGQVGDKTVSVRRNRVDNSMEYSSGNKSMDRAGVLTHAATPTTQRDTSGMAPKDMTDEEIKAVTEDLNNLLTAGAISRRDARHRREELRAEQARRAGNDSATPDTHTPEDHTAANEALAANTDQGLGSGHYGTVAESQNILDSHPGDAFVTKQGNLERTWFVGQDGRVHGVENPTGPGFDRQEFVDVVDGTPGMTVHAHDNNHANHADMPPAEPGDPATPGWADTAQPGATAYGSDGILATKNRDGSWSTPLGNEPADRFFAATDTQGVDNPTVVTNGPNPDGRPAGATNELHDAAGLRDVHPGDGITFVMSGGEQFHGIRNADGSFDVTLPGGITVQKISKKNILGDGSIRAWHVPNQSIDRSVDTPNPDVPNRPEPRVVTNPADYQTGDVISDYRHIRDMPAGKQITLTVPASQNGGREAQVVLTRTGNENDLGGFMFVVGNGGRGYNSFGENNASLFQAIHEGRVLFGDVSALDGTDRQRLEGTWSRERNIKAWEGGPAVSENDLRTYIASQVAANAMQKSYYDASLLPLDSPFRSAEFRRAFATKAKDKFSTPGNPMRSKPASIRYAADLLGLQYTDPGSTLIPDNLTLDDFRQRVDIGRWLRPGGSPENPAERNMGPEFLNVTRADIKTALAAMDNMLASDDHGDPDKILKRVFARQGSPLQDLNTSVAVAAYFGMKRYRINADGTRTPMTTIARQYDKRHNKALLRQMLLEQLEGRPPGYYGLPQDETFTRGRDGHTFVNTSTLQRPEMHAGNAPEAPSTPNVPEPTANDVNNALTSAADFRAVPQGERIINRSSGTIYKRTSGGYTPENSPVADSNGQEIPIALMETSAGVGGNYEKYQGDAPSAPSTPDVTVDTNLTTLDRRQLEDLASSSDNWEVAAGAREEIRRRDRELLNAASGSGMQDVPPPDPSTRNNDLPAPDSGNNATPPGPGAQHTPGSVVVGATVADLPVGSQVSYTRRDGRISHYTRGQDGIWRTNAGTAVDIHTWPRARFTVVTNPSATSAPSAPDATAATPSRAAGLSDTTVADVLNAPDGTEFDFTDRRGSTVRMRVNGDHLDSADGRVNGRWSRNQATLDHLTRTGSSIRAVEQPRAGEPQSPASPYREGDAFRGSDIRNVPVGAHIVGESGREYRVTETGIQNLGGHGPHDTYSFGAVENHNAHFTYAGDTAPASAESTIAQTAPDPRVGSMFDAAEIGNLPDGTYFRSTGGTIWRRHGRYMVSQNSGQRRYLSRLSGRYRFLGDNTSHVSGAAPTPAQVQTLEQAGLTRVPQSAIERYDRPRPMPNVQFDTTNTDEMQSYINTPEGEADLRRALEGALPAGSRVTVRATYNGFSASYSTPDGAHGSMERAFRGDGRIENAVARAGGASFSDVQDHLFAFYRQHGLREVEVHGLSGGTWNGAHTWVRRGFRPDPESESANFNTFDGLRQNLNRIITRTERGEYPHYQEFLDEAKDLSRRMNDLLQERWNLSEDERQDRLYKLWRELTYLGEVRNADGTTARGQRQSIGWRLLGTNSGGSNWYYGVRSLDDYFE